jgi:hypothetical protein
LKAQPCLVFYVCYFFSFLLRATEAFEKPYCVPVTEKGDTRHSAEDLIVPPSASIIKLIGSGLALMQTEGATGITRFANKHGGSLALLDDGGRSYVMGPGAPMHPEKIDQVREVYLEKPLRDLSARVNAHIGRFFSTCPKDVRLDVLNYLLDSIKLNLTMKMPLGNCDEAARNVISAIKLSGFHEKHPSLMATIVVLGGSTSGNPDHLLVALIPKQALKDVDGKGARMINFLKGKDLSCSELSGATLVDLWNGGMIFSAGPGLERGLKKAVYTQWNQQLKNNGDAEKIVRWSLQFYTQFKALRVRTYPEKLPESDCYTHQDLRDAEHVLRPF